MTEKLTMHTKDLVQDNVEKIRSLFPNCVNETVNAEGKIIHTIDFDTLKRQLSEDIQSEGSERYVFTWPGKTEAQHLANTIITKTLRPCIDESVDFDTTQNVFIEGDNLDALKLLRETYLGKIKMIYIDPPYNTGSDFIYCDNFAMGNKEYQEISGDYDQYGNRLVQNTTQNGKFHTNWLNMMYSRLFLAKELLSDDGVIFISIDDNELGNLIKLCDEIFNERNHLSTLIWNKQHSQQQGVFKRYHESILVYAKNSEAISNIEGGSGVIEAGAQKKISKANPESEFEFPAGVRFDAPDGTCISGTYGDSEKSTIVSGRLIAQNGKTLEPVVISAGWTQKNQMKSFFKGEDVFDSKGQRVTEFYFNSAGKLKCTKDRSKITPSSLLPEYGMVSEQTAQLDKLMGGHYFDNPKPINMIKDFISWFVKGNEIVLDFFAGSSTTAHAVMQINSEDGGQRRFIMVQIPALIDSANEAYKAGFKTISDVSKERIRRAGTQLKEATSEFGSLLDFGFRVFKVDSSNMSDIFYHPTAMKKDLLEFSMDNIKPNRSGEDLLVQVMLELGIELSAPIRKYTSNQKEVFDVDNGYLIACFDENVDEHLITEIANKKPMHAVLRDSSMANDSVAINLDQIFKTYSPNTKIRIL